jgi:hypothetical protein
LIVAPVLASSQLPGGLSTSTLLQSVQSLLEVAAVLSSALLIRPILSTPASVTSASAIGYVS